MTLTSLKALHQFHPHHLTLNSPWPLLSANAVFTFLTGSVLWFNSIQHGTIIMFLGLASVLISWTLWFKDVAVEGTLLGHHTHIVQSGLSIGVSLFIVTEAFFFVSIFWAYLHSSLAPTIELGTQWAPMGITALSPLTVPLVNTILLVSSGATVTYAHHALFNGNRSAALTGLTFTVILAIIFTGLQAFEYAEAGFSIADGIYGTCFFFSTGFQGAHVIVGTLFITVGLVRLYSYALTRSHHIGLESAILYWHYQVL